MSESAIRARIKTNLEGVSSLGFVYDYLRWTKDWTSFLSLFKISETVNGVMFHREQTFEKVLTPGEYLRNHMYKFYFFYSLDDSAASELTFQGIIEDICDAFRNDPTLNATCETNDPQIGPMTGKTGMQVDKIDNRLFGSVLCHYAELSLLTQEFLAL